MIYEVEETEYFTGLCAYCIPNSNAATPFRMIARPGTHFRDLCNGEIRFPNGNCIKISEYMACPVGGSWLTDFAIYFRGQILFTDVVGQQVPIYAVTMIDGTFVCNEHLSSTRRRS